MVKLSKSERERRTRAARIASIRKREEVTAHVRECEINMIVDFAERAELVSGFIECLEPACVPPPPSAVTVETPVVAAPLSAAESLSCIMKAPEKRKSKLMDVGEDSMEIATDLDFNTPLILPEGDWSARAVGNDLMVINNPRVVFCCKCEHPVSDPVAHFQGVHWRQCSRVSIKESK